MTDDQIKKGNEVILKFAGFIYYPKKIDPYSEHMIKDHWSTTTTNYEYPYNTIIGNNFKFHKSWDWLMPVAIKCKEIAKQQEDYSIGANHWNNVKIALIVCSIEDLFRNLVIFIEWYNENNN